MINDRTHVPSLPHFEHVDAPQDSHMHNMHKTIHSVVEQINQRLKEKILKILSAPNRVQTHIDGLILTPLDSEKKW